MAHPLSWKLIRGHAFAEWVKTQNAPGITPETFLEIIDYVLSRQTVAGSFPGDGNLWEIVQTSVVLKSLARLKFRLEDNWSLPNVPGGVKPALGFLCSKLTGSSADVGEDIWDTCQVLLAILAYDPANAACAAQVNRINQNWVAIFEAEWNAIDNRWQGPAYLAAMIDVVENYSLGLNSDSQAKPMVAKLVSLESDEKSGCFPCKSGDRNVTRWNSALVLRTLANLKNEPLPLELIARTALWLVSELKADGWRTIPQEEPMYRARALEGLSAAARVLDSRHRMTIEESVRRNGGIVNQLWRNTPRVGDLKAHTAVMEYLSSIAFLVPAGLALDAGAALSNTAFNTAGPEPDLVENGLRIAWLSDLHVAGLGDRRPERADLKRTLFGRFMLQLGTPLTQQFQQTNLQSILKRVEALRPDHILITGDVTNLALPEQFSTVHNLLIGTQRVLMNENPTSKLNPNLWTILPGNHDVSDQKKCAGQIRYNLCHFFEHFGELYPPASQADGYDNHFPVTKELKRPIKPEAGLAIRLICLDSNVEWPVTAVGFNARGRVDHIQWNRLPAALAAKKEGEVLLVALHHHPIVVPAMCTDLEDYFLSLDESTGRKLVALCATTGVSAILHGHFHKFSLWAGLVPPGTHPIHIVGSPAGTVSMPGQNTEFLELREATLNNRKGLALFLHSLKNGAWISTYNAFLD